MEELKSLKSVLYTKNGRVATITLNRPERLNAIDDHMPREIKICVDFANNDDDIHVILLTGAKNNFCSGYDLKRYAEAAGSNPGVQEDHPYDAMIDFKMMKENTDNFMRSLDLSNSFFFFLQIKNEAFGSLLSQRLR